MSAKEDMEVKFRDADAQHVFKVCSDVLRTDALIAWMDELINENVTLMCALSECEAENIDRRLCHLATQISVFRRIKDAANRALLIADGQPPSGKAEEPVEGDAL